MPEPSDVLRPIADYYGQKVRKFGATPRGVDWNGAEGQTLRFAQLCRVIPEPSGPGSLNDIGCGYGALHEWLRERGCPLDYLGVDIAPAMIELARERCGHGARFLVGHKPDRVADFGVASGIFNVRLDQDEISWRAYMQETLDMMSETSYRGFAFNALTIHSDPDRMRPDLHYWDPIEWFEWCRRRFSRHVALLHDYGLYEFTVLVRKES